MPISCQMTSLTCSYLDQDCEMTMNSLLQQLAPQRAGAYHVVVQWGNMPQNLLSYGYQRLRLRPSLRLRPIGVKPGEQLL